MKNHFFNLSPGYPVPLCPVFGTCGGCAYQDIPYEEELAFKEEHKVKTISDWDIRHGNGSKLVKDAVSVFDKLYVSIDLDVLDPAFAPGVGNPEAVGITSRELYDMISSLKNQKIIGADIVELCPTYDNGATASMAARLMSAIIAMNVKK